MKNITKEQLKQRLRKLKLPVTGLKSVLRERLRTTLQKDSSDKDDNKDESGEDEKSAVMRTTT